MDEVKVLGKKVRLIKLPYLVSLSLPKEDLAVLRFAGIQSYQPSVGCLGHWHGSAEGKLQASLAARHHC